MLYIYCVSGGLVRLTKIMIKSLTEVCSNVATKPPIATPSKKLMRLASANIEDGAHLDIQARGFGTITMMHFMMLEFFIPTPAATANTRMRGGER